METLRGLRFDTIVIDLVVSIHRCNSIEEGLFFDKRPL